MNASQIEIIERHLGSSLPLFYRETMLSYPFDGLGDISESELVNDVELFVKLNTSLDSQRSPHLIAIGSDRGEEIYLIEREGSSTAVHCFNLETNTTEVAFKSWSDFLQHCRQTAQQQQEDQNAQSNVQRSWWKLW